MSKDGHYSVDLTNLNFTLYNDDHSKRLYWLLQFPICLIAVFRRCRRRAAQRAAEMELLKFYKIKINDFNSIFEEIAVVIKKIWKHLKHFWEIEFSQTLERNFG